MAMNYSALAVLCAAFVASSLASRLAGSPESEPDVKTDDRQSGAGMKQEDAILGDDQDFEEEVDELKDDDVDCQLTWNAWSSCSVTCGGGTQTRTSDVTKVASGFGEPCPGSPESRACNTAKCATTSTTTTTTRRLTRIEQLQAQLAEAQAASGVGEYGLDYAGVGGNQASSHDKYRSKDFDIRRAHGRGSYGGSFTEFSNTEAKPDVKTDDRQSGAGMKQEDTILGDDQDFEEELDELEDDDVDCEFTWNDWSSCSLTCGGGTQTRTSDVTKVASGFGEPCPGSPESRACNTAKCATTSTTTTTTRRLTRIEQLQAQLAEAQASGVGEYGLDYAGIGGNQASSHDKYMSKDFDIRSNRHGGSF